MNIDGNKIDLLLAEHGINNTLLAKRAGISRQSVSTVKKRGTCNPTTAAKLAKALGVPVSEIIQD